MKKIGPGALVRSICFALSHSFFALTLLILAVPATVKSDNEPRFTTIDFPGANISTAWAINSAGDLIGTYTYGDQHPQVGTIIDQPGYGFLLSRNSFTSIVLPGAFHTLPYAINDHGTIVGVYEEAFNNMPNRKVHSFQLRLGYPTSFDFPGSKSNSAWGINAAGDIVGRYVAADGTAHGYLLHDGEFTSIDYPGAISTWARGITPSGDIMGLYTAADGTGRGFMLRDGEFTSIDYPGAIFTNALGVNAAGDIVGRYDSADGRQHGYVLRNGRFTSIDFPGANRTINLRGEIVGEYIISPGGKAHAFLLSGVERGQNAIEDPAFFVRQHYLDFLNREPDADGLAFWTSQITSCGIDTQCIEAKRINVSAAYFLSIEFQETGYEVYRLYRAAYGDLAGAPVPIRFSEFMTDTQAIGNGVIVNQPGWEQALERNKQEFAADFVQRSRFTSAYPASMTPEAFVDTLFTKAGLTPASSERAAAINEFGSASATTDVTARARAVRRVGENAALIQQEFNRAFVLMQYFGYLRRNPNNAPDTNFDGYNFWLNKLNQFKGDFAQAEMVKAFVNSIEYGRRFGP